MFVTFFDTCMVSLAAMFVWRISPFIVAFPWLIIICLDGTYLSSALTKVPDGAWFTLTLAAVLASLLLLWRFGKEQQWFAEAEDRYPTSHFVTASPDGRLRLSDRFDSIPVSTTRGLGIFFDKAGETTPIVFSQFVLKLTAIPEVIVFFHLRPLERPSVAAKDRHSVSRLALPNCYRLVVRYGYNDEIISPDLALVISDQVRRQIIADKLDVQSKIQSENSEAAGDGSQNNSTDDSTPTSEKQIQVETKYDVELAKLETAVSDNVIYVMGKEQMRVKQGTNYFRMVLLWIFLWIRDNTRTKIANLKVPTEKVIEVGFLKDV
jgi:KUP system potassium uptake protein